MTRPDDVQRLLEKSDALPLRVYVEQLQRENEQKSDQLQQDVQRFERVAEQIQQLERERDDAIDRGRALLEQRTAAERERDEWKSQAMASHDVIVNRQKMIDDLRAEQQIGSFILFRDGEWLADIDGFDGESEWTGNASEARIFTDEPGRWLDAGYSIERPCGPPQDCTSKPEGE